MYLAIIAALSEAEADSALRAVLFAGAGGAFTAGNDLKDFFEGPRPGEEFPALSFVKTLAAFSKPMVAAVAGDAVGVGTTMLFHCDLVYAAPDARFKMPFVDLGLVPEAGVSLLAPRLFGQAKAAQYLLLCESFDAQEALRLNLVNAVTDDPLAVRRNRRRAPPFAKARRGRGGVAPAAARRPRAVAGPHRRRGAIVRRGAGDAGAAGAAGGVFRGEAGERLAERSRRSSELELRPSYHRVIAGREISPLSLDEERTPRGAFLPLDYVKPSLARSRASLP